MRDFPSETVCLPFFLPPVTFLGLMKKLEAVFASLRCHCFLFLLHQRAPAKRRDSLLRALHPPFFRCVFTSNQRAFGTRVSSPSLRRFGPPFLQLTELDDEQKFFFNITTFPFFPPKQTIRRRFFNSLWVKQSSFFHCVTPESSCPSPAVSVIIFLSSSCLRKERGLPSFPFPPSFHAWHSFFFPPAIHVAERETLILPPLSPGAFRFSRIFSFWALFFFSFSCTVMVDDFIPLSLGFRSDNEVKAAFTGL